MKKAALLIGAGSIILFLFLAACRPAEKAGRPDLDPFFSKPDVTIAVTDSGLGGLAIMAQAAARLKAARIFKSVNLVFFNALFSNDSGYNSLPSRAEKIAVFNSALESLAQQYRPDLILVGCNTLSVLYEETPFFKQAKIPVLGIVEPGVDLLSNGLEKKPGSAAIIFGTETTIGEGEHKKRLLEKGFPEERIVTQACPELAGYIENGLHGEDTGLLIESYVDEALANLKNRMAHIWVSLNCTHFGYSLDLWKKAFESRGIKSFFILNPNSKMTDILISPKYEKRFADTAVRAKAVSMVEVGRPKIDSLGAWLRRVSPETADALAQVELKPDLFEWKRFIKRWDRRVVSPERDPSP